MVSGTSAGPAAGGTRGADGRDRSAPSPARPRACERPAVLSGWLRWKPVPVDHGPEETAGDG